MYSIPGEAYCRIHVHDMYCMYSIPGEAYCLMKSSCTRNFFMYSKPGEALLSNVEFMY